METEQKPLTKHFKVALGVTLVWIVACFWLGGALDVDYRIFGVSMAAGWLPMVVIGIRRPQRPTKLDVFVLFAGHPIVFFALAAFSHWYLGKH
jgi:hypothetical protein